MSRQIMVSDAASARIDMVRGMTGKSCSDVILQYVVSDKADCLIDAINQSIQQIRAAAAGHELAYSEIRDVSERCRLLLIYCARGLSQEGVAEALIHLDMLLSQARPKCKPLIPEVR